MSTVIANLLVRIGAETSGLDKGLGEVTSKVNKTASNLQSVGSTLTKYVTAPLAALGGLALKSSIDFESAFAGVRKTVDASEETFARLEQGIRDMAREIPASAGSIAQVAEAAGQLGIKTENILSFTRVMIDLGEATNLSADEAATALARLANITGMPQESFDRLGSSIVALGNNLATTEAEIVQMSLRLAGAGAQIGLTEAEITGFAAALSSVGIEAEAGGSAFSRVMINMAQAARQGGDQLDLFASVAGVTAQQFREAFETDAAGAIQMFIEGLRRMSVEGGNTFGVLEDLGLSEIRVRDALLRTSGASDVLASSLQISRRAWEENTALTNEASQRYATTESVLRILWNRLVEVARTVGDALKPAFVSLLQSLEPVFQRVEQLAQAFAAADPATQKLVIGIGALAASIGPLLVTLSSLAKAFVFVKEGLALLPASFGPIGIAVTAFAALAVLLITNWESVVSFFRERFPTAFLAAQVALDTFKNAAESFADAVKVIFDGLVDSVEIVADGISKAFEGAFEGQAETTKKELDTIKGFWDEFGDDINEELDRDMKRGADTMSTALTTIGRIVRLFMNPFISDWRSNLENLASIFTDIWDFIVRRLADYVDRFLHGLEAISEFFGGKWKTEIQNARKAVDEFAQGLQVGGVKIKRAGDEISDGMERAASSTREFDVKAFDTGNSLSGLEGRFAALAKAAHDAAGPTKDVAAGTGAAGDAADKAADKWETYAKAMKEAEARHKALGDDLDFVKAKISATETLLVEMAKSGDTSSDAYKRLREQLRELNAELKALDPVIRNLNKVKPIDAWAESFKQARDEIDKLKATLSAGWTTGEQKVAAFEDAFGLIPGIRKANEQLHAEMEALGKRLQEDGQSLFGKLYGAISNASWGTVFEPVIGAFESFSNFISGKSSFADSFSSIINFGTDLARSFKSGAVDIGQSLQDIAEGVISQFGPYGQVAGAVLGFMDELGLGLDDIGSRLGRLLGIGQGGKHSNPDIAAAREMIDSLRNQGVALEEIIEIVAQQFDTLSKADIEGLATGINTAFINLRDWAGEWDDNQREKMDVFNSVIQMLQGGMSQSAVRGVVGSSDAFADEVRKFGLDRVTKWVDEILAKVEQFGVTFDPEITVPPPDMSDTTETVERSVDDIFAGISTSIKGLNIGGTLEEQYDALNAKADILRQGIADLIAAGVDPASAQFRNLTMNLQSTERQIENIAKQMKIEGIFGDMAASMEDIENKALVLGDTFNAAGAKVSLLENTMVELLKAGVDPASSEFKLLGMQLDLARAEAEKFANEMRVQEIWDRLGDSLEDVRAKARVLGDEFNHFEAEARIMEQALIDLAREGKYATPEFMDLSRSLDETRRNAANLDEQMRRQDAWERLQRDLKQIDAQAFVLGDTFNATEAKARVVERAMIDLIANGIDPSSSAYRILEEALRTGNFSADLFTDTIRKQTDAYSELNYVASQVPGWIRAQNEAMQETYNRNIAPVPKALSELEAEYKALLDKAAGIRARLDDPSTSAQSARNLRINLQSVERLIESTFKRLEEARKAAATTTKSSTTSTSTSTSTFTSQPRTTTSYSSGSGSSVSLDTRNIEKGLDEIRKGIDEMSSLMVSAAGELIRVIESGAKPSDGGGRSWQEIVDTIIGLAGRTAEVAAAGAASQVASTSALQQTVDSIVREQSAMSGQLEALLRALDTGRISSIQLRELSKLLSDDREVSKMLEKASALKGQEQRQIVQHINIVLDKRRLAETTLQGFPEVIYAHGGGR